MSEGDGLVFEVDPEVARAWNILMNPEPMRSIQNAVLRAIWKDIDRQMCGEEGILE